VRSAPTCLPTALDIADYEQVAAFAADIHSAIGGPNPGMDVVMNIAGVSAWERSAISPPALESMVSIT
jgi:NAD(P)-dependent dehydrogenase (short-subunit alcohol dehydrogenase family)